jgi:hypothetical protein
VCANDCSCPSCTPQGPTECTPNVDCAAKCADTIDNDCDGLIDCTDPDCGPAICGGGSENGQTCSTDATILACTNGGGVCVCPKIKKDPSTIHFGPPDANLDVFKSHGRVVPGVTVDVGSAEVQWLVTNDATGQVVYHGVLYPGDMTASGSGMVFRYQDSNARLGQGRRSGIYKAKIRLTRGGTSYGYRVEAYGDMSAATNPNMSIQLYIGSPSQSFVHKEPWTQRSWGWKATGFD